jgi:phosphatidylserine synthase
MDKVPPHAAFLDLSDYARPLARWLVYRLLPTSITSIHLTLAFTLCGFAAALLFAFDSALPLAGALLIVKSWLDAADGMLARARRQPSRVGRFLDSLCDFAVTVAVFLSIGIGHSNDFALAGLSILCATLQCSVFNYYAVRYRAQVGGDQTSRIDERDANGYPSDNPAALRVLHTLYLLIYAWQDALMHGIDQAIARQDRPLEPAFLTRASILGLGSQLLAMALCAALGQPIWALWLFVTVFNVYWLALLVYRHITQ